MAHVTVISEFHFAQQIVAGHHRVTADEPQSRGGSDTGPSPTELLLGSLGACTSITLRMYAGRKGWELGKITVGLRYTPAADGRKAHIERRLSFAKPAHRRAVPASSGNRGQDAGDSGAHLRNHHRHLDRAAHHAGLNLARRCGGRSAPALSQPQQRTHPLEVLGRIDPGGRSLLQCDHVDAHAVLERAQLLELLGGLERRRRPARRTRAGSSPDKHRCRCDARRA